MVEHLMKRIIYLQYKEVVYFNNNPIKDDFHLKMSMDGVPLAKVSIIRDVWRGSFQLFYKNHTFKGKKNSVT